MDDIAYRNAMRRRKELQAEIADIDRFLEMWKRYAGTESGNVEPTGNKAGAVSPPHTPGRTMQRLQRERHAKDIRNIIVTAGRPLTRGQIIEGLDKHDILVGGKDKSKNIGTVMWRLRDRFVNIAGEGYWPKDMPCLAVGYEPKAESKNDLDDTLPDDFGRMAPRTGEAN